MIVFSFDLNIFPVQTLLKLLTDVKNIKYVHKKGAALRQPPFNYLEITRLFEIIYVRPSIVTDPV